MRDGNKKWMVSTDELALTFELGRRPALGVLLLAQPRSLARARWWATVQDPIARVVMDGVRTRGTAGGGRREWYSAQDMQRIKSVSARFDGVDLGDIRPVTPARAVRLRLHPGGPVDGQGAHPDQGCRRRRSPTAAP